MAEHDELPARTWRTGTVQYTITEAHPYHKPVGKIDHRGAGAYKHAYDPRCPFCRAEAEKEE